MGTDGWIDCSDRMPDDGQVVRFEDIRHSDPADAVYRGTYSARDHAWTNTGGGWHEERYVSRWQPESNIEQLRVFAVVGYISLPDGSNMPKCYLIRAGDDEAAKQEVCSILARMTYPAGSRFSVRECVDVLNFEGDFADNKSLWLV